MTGAVRFVGVVCLTLCLGPVSVVFGQQDVSKDRQLAAAVEERLYATEGGHYHRVDAEARDQTVTLTGTVANLLDQRDAVEIVESMRGVQDVNDRISVALSRQSDESIANSIEASLQSDPATAEVDTRIAVADGIVMLTGTAQSQQERWMVDNLVARISGVRAIQNNIEISYRNETADEKIQADIAVRLQALAWFEASQVKLQVQQGAVRMSGKIGSAVERRWIERAAWVEGTRSVDVSGLKIQSDDTKVRRRTAKASDQQIADLVRTALNYNPRVKSATVGVAVLNAVVTLTGTVNTYAAKLAAGKDAAEVYGVEGLQNMLKVRSSSTATDEELEQRIRAALSRDSIVDRSEISVRVSNGNANLYGTVDSSTEAARAQWVVASVDGLVNVTNYLKYNQPNRSDTQLQQSIERQIFWSPFIGRDDVTVAVDNGVATLTGRTDSWAERQAAGKNARDGGATRVRNQIGVEYGPGRNEVFK